MFDQALALGRLWDPLREVERLQEEMNRLFRGTRQAWAETEYPRVSVWVNDDEAVVAAEVPGLNAADLDISVAEQTLTLRGSRRPEQLKEGETYHRQERAVGEFARNVQLPFRADANRVGARLSKGVLWVTLPRLESDKPKKITVKTA
jgi:HSP20 family protein